MGIVYKLFNNEKGLTYIGSTKKSLQERLKYHLKHYKAYQEGKHNFVYSFKILELDNYEIEELEKVENNDELKIIESKYINKMDCVNKYKSIRTLEDIKEQRKKDNEKYKLNNPEKYKEHSNKRNIKIICSCGCEISKRNIARHLNTHN